MPATTPPYPRDLVGYGANPPDPRWPGGARLAVQFVINVEEGGEHNILHGDTESEAFVTEEPTIPLPGRRNLNVESQYEFGSRTGFWRLHRLFTERDLPVTVFGIATALDRAPAAVAAMHTAGWEIASHGLRWIDYSTMAEEQEAEHIGAAITLHRQATGAAPTGWYTGRMSHNTRRLIYAAGDFRYDSDSFSDDLPYWVADGSAGRLVIPYTLDNNDVRYAHAFGFNSPRFSDYLGDAMELLLAEGAHAPKMMSVGLHTRISGRAGRAADLARFLDRVVEAQDLWVPRRIDIAEHWHAEHPWAGRPEIHEVALQPEESTRA